MLSYTSTKPFVLEDTDSGEVVAVFDSLGIFYDYHSELGTCTLIKHGEYDVVFDIYEAYKDTVSSVLNDLSMFNFKMIKVTSCSLEDLNHIISTSLLPESHFLRLIKEKK